jgi:phosphotransferase system  glucose/maltose/N-acetylglucosamine-specific IIC component
MHKIILEVYTEVALTLLVALIISALYGVVFYLVVLRKTPDKQTSHDKHNSDKRLI